MRQFVTILLFLSSLSALAQFSSNPKTPDAPGVYNVGRNKNSGIWEEVESNGQRRALNGVAQHLTIKGVRSLSYSAANTPKTINVTDPRRAGLFIADVADNSSTDDGAMTLVTSSGVRYKRSGYISLNPKWFGAIGDSITNDQPAFQSMFNYAKSIRNASIELDPNAKYKLTSGVVYDVSGLGQIKYNNRSLVIHGNNAKIFLSGKLDSFYGFSFLFGNFPQQDAKYSIDNLYFYTDNVNRPNAIRIDKGCFLTLDNCYFNQVWVGVRVQHAGQIRIQNCQFFGTGVGVSSFSNHDIMITGCQAFGCTYGFQLLGINDAGSDGGLVLDNSETVSCTYGIDISGVHAPILNNIFCDVLGGYGIRVQNCGWGKLSNIWIGPPNTHSSRGIYGIYFKHNKGDFRKDYWQINNVKVETECRFENCLALDMSNLHCAMNPVSVSGGAMYFVDCHEVKIDARMRDIGKLSYGLVLDSLCTNFDIRGSYDKGPLFKGTRRGGGHTVKEAKFLTAPVFTGGVKPTELGTYQTATDSYILKNGKMLPSITLPVTSMTKVGQTVNIDVNTIVPVPEPAGVYIATFVSSSGVFGSFGSAVIQVVRNFEGTKAMIINNLPSVSNTVSIPSDNIIRFTCNVNASTTAKLTLINLEKVY